jgi:Sigma-70 region 2
LNAADEAAVVAAARAGDESAFAALVECYRRELRVHCYRMLGSLDESEDLVQETFLRAGSTSTPSRAARRSAPSEAELDAEVVARETIELAFLAAIQHLPPASARC